MRTILTETISIDAAPDAVLRFVADPRNLPLWAPAFARRVRPEGPHWLIDGEQSQLRVDVRVSRELGTVDFLDPDAPRDRPRGAYSRVVRNGSGSEYSFTRFLPRELDREEVTRERAALAQELETVRRCCERKAGVDVLDGGAGTNTLVQDS